AEVRLPALFVFHVDLLRAITTTPGGMPPQQIIEQHLSSGPMQWNQALNALTFACSYWRFTAREWVPIFIHAKSLGRPFLDGADAIQLHGELGDGTTVESIPLSIAALSSLRKLAASKKRFVMASELGVKTFNDFAAFEHLYLEAAKEVEEHGMLHTAEMSRLP
ncbi:MAG: hypothetical protein JF607_14530, partial [Burkholderiales bacterium]|nr:hypothetical protein [Burkholderiales bacterium]